MGSGMGCALSWSSIVFQKLSTQRVAQFVAKLTPASGVRAAPTSISQSQRSIPIPQPPHSFHSFAPFVSFLSPLSIRPQPYLRDGVAL